MKKKEKQFDETNPRAERLLKLLDRYGTVDREKREINVKLHYDSINDLVAEDISTPEKPIISDCVIEKAETIIDKCPPKFGLSLDVQVNDFEDYKPENLCEAFNDSMELEHYHTLRHGRKSWYLAAALALIGIGLLIVLNVLKATGIIGDVKMEDTIIDYVIDTFACVFIWECLSFLILYPAEFYTRNNKVFSAFRGIKLLDKTGKVVFEENKDEMMKEWVEESDRKRLGKAFLMITGAALLAVGTTTLASIIVTLFKTDYASLTPQQYTGIITSGIVVSITGVCEILSGIGALNDVREKGLFRNFVKVFIWILLVLYATTFGLAIYAGITQGASSVPTSTVLSSIFGLVFSVLVLIGCHYSKEKDLKHQQRVEKEKEQRKHEKVRRH